MECQRLNSECHRVSEVRFGGMAPVSDAPQSHRISGDSGAGRIGVPSTGLSLSRLLASRADLRFTRQDHDNRWCWQKPDESEFNDQAELREYSLTEGVFCPNNGVHCRYARVTAKQLNNTCSRTYPVSSRTPADS